ncbi:M16 family metallopeptidase [Nocardioides cynanchi]|uniref:M16 family metallopeptidase n=1 Tax=Nocardioides cynanchi TaxID=2558918 RepID=UPI001783231A|nr:pitrilysin family protein [Nocardioides cynanchi]
MVPATTGRQPAAGRSSVSQANGSTRTLLKGDDGVVRRTVLPSGLRIITEQVPGQRSATIGVWVGVGSRDETPALHGCSHFLEHLLFKGTPERSALEISIALDAVGGEFNAFTAKEYTCFHARVLDEDLPLAVDVLGDMITSSTITEDDVDAEREVILDEIAMHDDDPDDVAHNLFSAQAWGDSPLGRPIAGTAASIEAMTRDQVLRFYRRHYRPERMVVAVAGNVDHTKVVRLVRRAFARNDFLAGTASPVAARQVAKARRVGSGVVEATRQFEQVNVVLGVNGITRSDDRRFALGVLNAALGGGTSSRLFQEVREKRGLAYSVFSFASQHIDAGLVGVSVGCLPAKLEQVLEVVRAELAKVADAGITADELARGKGQLKGGLVLGLEDSASRMSRLGKSELVDDDLLSIDEVLARVEAVTLDDVHALATTLFTQPEILAVVGPR